MSDDRVSMKPLLDYLRTIPTGYVTDTFSRLGLSGSFGGLLTTRPLCQRKIVGPAVTAWLAPIRGKRSGKSLYQFFRESPPGSVAVFAGGVSNGATIGNNATTQALVAGLEAIIIDGAIRDLAEVRELSIPIMYRATAIPVATWLEVAATNVPVTCAGAQIYPGDIVFADDDGGLVIPPEYLDEVVRNAQDVARLEERQGEIIRSGASLEELAVVLRQKKTGRV